MPQLNADGDVIDIALHTVKVQNWDKTITSIPTALHFRLVQELARHAGIRRTAHQAQPLSDQQSVFSAATNASACIASTCWTSTRPRRPRKSRVERQARRAWRRITGYRAVRRTLLRSHGGIHQNMTLIVRQLSPTAEDSPRRSTASPIRWTQYEAIQSDIFDHLAILPSRAPAQRCRNAHESRRNARRHCPRHKRLRSTQVPIEPANRVGAEARSRWRSLEHCRPLSP